MKLLPLSKLLAAAALATACGAGCLGSAVTSGPGSDSDQGVNGIGNGGPDMAIDIHAEFDAKVKPLLVGDCGSCHSTPTGGVGPGFLSPNPDVFTTVINYPGLIGGSCDTSRVLLKDVHVGPSYHASPGYTPSADLAAHAMVICDWITLYNQIGGFGHATGADMTVKARIEPFAPTPGTKSLDLGLLDPAFTGATLSFDVTMVGATQIMLSNLTLKATAGSSVHIKSPVFATYAAADTKVAIDINYDYLSKEFYAGAGTTVTFSPPLTIFSYTAGQLLNVSVAVLDSGAGAPDMGGSGVATCKDLTAFGTFLPNLTAALPGMNNACSAGGCHGASGGVGGLNLNGITATNAGVCQSVLNNVILSAPDSSPLYLHPTDGSNHTGGKISAANQPAYKTAVEAFVTAQK